MKTARDNKKPLVTRGTCHGPSQIWNEIYVAAAAATHNNRESVRQPIMPSKHSFCAIIICFIIQYKNRKKKCISKVKTKQKKIERRRIKKKMKNIICVWLPCNACCMCATCNFHQIIISIYIFIYILAATIHSACFSLSLSLACRRLYFYSYYYCGRTLACRRQFECLFGRDPR